MCLLLHLLHDWFLHYYSSTDSTTTWEGVSVRNDNATSKSWSSSKTTIVEVNKCMWERIHHKQSKTVLLRNHLTYFYNWKTSVRILNSKRETCKFFWRRKTRYWSEQIWDCEWLRKSSENSESKSLWLRSWTLQRRDCKDSWEGSIVITEQYTFSLLAFFAKFHCHASSGGHDRSLPAAAVPVTSTHFPLKESEFFVWKEKVYENSPLVRLLGKSLSDVPWRFTLLCVVQEEEP